MDENLILVAGLPGSEKTTYLSEMLRGGGLLVFDDFKKGGKDLRFRSSPKFCALVGALCAGVKCIVADIHFCKDESRQEAEDEIRKEVPDVRLCWRFFENDAAACEANIRARNRDCVQSELEYLAQYSRQYRIPHDAVIFSVWK